MYVKLTLLFYVPIIIFFNQIIISIVYIHMYLVKYFYNQTVSKRRVFKFSSSHDI